MILLLSVGTFLWEMFKTISWYIGIILFLGWVFGYIGEPGRRSNNK